MSKEFPRAIVHFDGDSFFASVEIALNHTLRGLPVVTGAERGAATAMSYEAKRRGVTRGMTLRQVRSVCPDAVVVDSDYTAYSLYAHRMYRIARRFTPLVEEYSIDECFADITGLDRAYGMSYEDIARAIKKELEDKLGITFGVGLAPTKVLAKVASKFRKPAGFTVITVGTAPEFLRTLPAGSVWGIGPASAMMLSGLGIKTALDLAQMDLEWVRRNNIAKPYRTIWYELRGTSVSAVAEEPGSDIGSIIKSRTFSPPSTEKEFVYSQLCKNVERACARARQSGVRSREVGMFLKTQEFLFGRAEVALPAASADPRDLLRALRPHFDRLYKKGVPYRATGVTLRALVPDELSPLDLFGAADRVEGNGALLRAVDALNRRFGEQTVGLAASSKAARHTEPTRTRAKGRRLRLVLKQPYHKKTLDLPFLGVVR